MGRNFDAPQEETAKIPASAGMTKPNRLTLTALAFAITSAAAVATVLPKEAEAAKPARPLAPEPAGEPETGLVRLRKPFDPGTFYVDKPEIGKSMGEGHPRGFDVEKDGSITFFVTGDKSGNMRISLELYPWVPSDEKKRAAAGSMKVKITMDGEEYELVPQPLPKGKILPATKTDEEALLDTPLRLQTIPVAAGTHEIVVTSQEGSHFRVVLSGPAETSKSDIDAAIERPFEEDPNAPSEFYMNARLVTAAEEPSGYKLEPITKSPLKLDKIHIERIRNSTLVRVRLAMGDITYVSEKPLMPQTDHRVRFTRVTPPARSTDSGGPDELPLNVTVTGNPKDGYKGEADVVPGMTCQTTRRANFHCWEVSEDESRVRAFRGRLDTRPTSPAENPRHYTLRKY